MHALKTLIAIVGLLITSGWAYAQELKTEPTLDETLRWISDNIDGFTVSAKSGNRVVTQSVHGVAINSCNIVLQDVQHDETNEVAGGNIVDEHEREYRIPVGRLRPPTTSTAGWGPLGGEAPVLFLATEAEAIRMHYTNVHRGSSRIVTPSTSSSDQTVSTVGIFSKDVDLVNRMQKAFSRAITLCKAKELF